MRKDIGVYTHCQVFLNYPYDAAFAPLADAMNFAVIAGGMLPLCANDTSVPDRTRLDGIVSAIRNSHYSAHDFSRYTGEGEGNLARMNMPLEMGMALFHALNTQRESIRCAFFVPTPHDYQRFAGDLAGLDPKCHYNDPIKLLNAVYEWLRAVVAPAELFNSIPIGDVQSGFSEFTTRLARVAGSGTNGNPSHDEGRELMYTICSERGWWDWRNTKAGKVEFPVLPLTWKPAESGV